MNGFRRRRMLKEESFVSAEEIAKRVKELGDYSTNIELWKVSPLTDKIVDIYYVDAKEENRDGSRSVWDLERDVIEDFLGGVLRGTGWGVDDFDYPEFMTPEDRDEQVVHIVLKPQSFKESRRPRRGRKLWEEYLDSEDENDYDYEFDFAGARDSIRTASEAIKRVHRIFWDGEPAAAPESEITELYEKLTELRDAVEELIDVVEP